ncbi:MAG: putative sugar transporter ATP-binding protein [Streptosporangiaceae bacterium]|nr:putative sugar transporter ATP-binding protein [Streptosporangiaceae bacterium]
MGTVPPSPADAPAPGPAAREPAFVARGVTKTYPGVQALRGVDLEGYPGEVLAICGANGAGKSTFARLLAGQEAPSAGEIQVTGHGRPIRDPADAERAGVLLMHQEPLVIDHFTVGENVWLHKLRGGRDVRPWSRSRATTDGETRNALAHVGLGSVPPDQPAGGLAPGQRQMLALSRAVVTEHRILILDETTASTTEAYFESVRDMVAEEKRAGTAVVFVSHRMQEVFSLADRIAVFRNGSLVDVLDAKTTDEDEITTLMIGNAVKALRHPPELERADEEPLLRVRDLASGSASGISFDVRRGEILGIYGLVGSGRSSVARAITGQQPMREGAVTAGGRPVRLNSPGAALRHGLAYVTEDRRKEGFVRDFTNEENLSLVTLPRLARAGIISRRRERTRTRDLITKFQVKGGADTMTSTLSGGNQQKVCIAKWLEADPDIVVLDEPTKGIDIGARANIYEIVYDLARQGKSVVVVSSEAEEILLLSHRVLVMRDGAATGEFDAAESTTEDLIRAALGGEVR